MSSIEKDPKSDAVTGDMSSIDGASGGLGDMRDSPHSKPRSGERDVSGDDNLEMLRIEREREMRSLKEEERRLTMASKKDTMQRQLEMQRQKVQNLRGTTSVLISGSGRKKLRKATGLSPMVSRRYRCPMRFPLVVKMTMIVRLMNLQYSS